MTFVCGERFTGRVREIPRDRGARSTLDCRLRDVKCHYVILYNSFKFVVSSSHNSVEFGNDPDGCVVL
jgi:hypothetical protein